jgi:hypothetical protein
VATLARMSGRNDQGGDDVRQHSGWLIPLMVFVVTAGLSALFLLFYLAPNPTSFIQQHAAPTAMTDPVSLTVGDLSFRIPANYIVYSDARQGGVRKDVALFAALPDFKGYSTAKAPEFANHSAESPVVYMLVREEHLNLPENERLKRIYMNYVLNPEGRPGPFGLTQYTFRDDNGYRGEDMFVGGTPDKPVVMRCWRFTADMSNPDCLRDRRLSRGVALTYRFKRANLGQWREIAEGVGALIGGFEAAAK